MDCSEIRKEIRNKGIPTRIEYLCTISVAIVQPQTAISIPDTLFKDAEMTAIQSGLARSQLSLITKPVLKIDMGGAVTNFNTQVGLVSEIIFGEENPDPEKYIDTCIRTFGTDFFYALSCCIKEKHKEAGIVQRIMNIPIADAKGVYRALAEKTDFT